MIKLFFFHGDAKIFPITQQIPEPHTHTHTHTRSIYNDDFTGYIHN